MDFLSGDRLISHGSMCMMFMVGFSFYCGGVRVSVTFSHSTKLPYRKKNSEIGLFPTSVIPTEAYLFIGDTDSLIPMLYPPWPPLHHSFAEMD